ncbi:MAG TPA: type II toxin-antitoxin system HicB family antitoxin, partial [Polyangiaceae bacterium]|nr:type II toxin-antitoxin system HicB family antitoxin [Polyangiaceae bacterium]
AAFFHFEAVLRDRDRSRDRDRRGEARQERGATGHAIGRGVVRVREGRLARGYLPLPADATFVRAMRILVTLERDETGMIVAECPAIPGCVSQGRTEDEALANIREAVIGCLEVRAEEGLPLTVRTVDIEVRVA